MTYVSRKTRIIVSRWSDECDAEYTLRACRKRSDGRLKRHASCDDLRAWINDSCVKHEYLVDLMSDGEVQPQNSFSKLTPNAKVRQPQGELPYSNDAFRFGVRAKTPITLCKPPFRLYGRFIPVPILFKLMQKTKIENERGADNVSDFKECNTRRSRSDEREGHHFGGATDSARRFGSKCIQVKQTSSDSGSQDSKLESKLSFTRLEWEKSLLEKRLCECTCLLNKAVGQLERIDNIVGITCDETDNIENSRTEQIRDAFYKSKLRCTCPVRSNNSPSLSQSKSYVRKLRESAKCAELLRKISGLREKLKKIQDCRQEISQQIRASKIRVENCSSSNQVTELYSRREQAYIKRLQKKLEKLITTRGRLLSEMCQTLTCLNGIKKSSRSSMNFSKKRSRTSRNSEDFHNEKAASFSCGYTCSEYNESTDSETVRCSDSSSGESGMNRGYAKCPTADLDFKSDLEVHNAQMNCADEFFDDDSFDSDQCSGEEDNNRNAKDQRRNPRLSELNRVPAPGPRNLRKQKTLKNQKLCGNSSDDKSGEKDDSKMAKKSGVKFVCPESSCKRRLYADDLSAYEDSLSQVQQALILGAIKNIQNRRPTTSPTTKRERDAFALEQHRPCGHTSHQSLYRDCIPERQIKSETTMKEIEKTLRNYEQRLNQLGSLECKIEDLKQKSSEADRFKEGLERFKAEVKRKKAVEREKSNREMTQLCSENWELKKQVQQLTAKFEAQCKKVQNMKSAMLKARELECEAEELKKELSKYRDSFEQQRKCMSKWESVVAVQRTEIENLMNHIRKLTTMKEEVACNAYQMRKCIQRSRSYSPDMKTRGVANRTKPSTRNYRASSEEEDVPCYCNQCLQGENRRKGHQRSSERGYCSPSPTRGMEWCN